MFRIFRAKHAYTVHEKPEPPAERGDRAEALRFVREGFSLFAALVPPLWMVANRLWLVLVLYLIAVGAILGLLIALEVPQHWHHYALMALNLLVGFEADALIRWSLDRKGWQMIGTVSGIDFEECERRFFERWVPTVGFVGTSAFERPGNFSATTPEPARDGDLMPPKRKSWQTVGGWRSFRRT